MRARLIAPRGRMVRVLRSSRDGAPANRRVADGSSHSLEDAMPRFWSNRRRSDGLTRKWNGLDSLADHG